MTDVGARCWMQLWMLALDATVAAGCSMLYARCWRKMRFWMLDAGSWRGQMAHNQVVILNTGGGEANTNIATTLLLLPKQLVFR